MGNTAPRIVPLQGGTALPQPNLLRQVVISTVLLLAIGVFLLTRGGDFSGTLQLLLNAPTDLILVAIGLEAGTYFAAVMSYMALAADKPIRLGPTMAVQVASGITNRLLPAGLGGAGLYTVYLKKSGFRYTQATAIVAANNIFGAIGNAILLAIAIMLAPKPGQLLNLQSFPVALAAAAAVAVAVLIAYLVFRGRWLQRVKMFVHDMVRSLGFALKPGKRSIASLLSNMTITALNGLILSLAVVAAGGDMYWPLTIAVLSVGALLGAAVPTPGGLGAIEAGILAGLVACGVPAAPALAATLIYRGLTYWLPIIPGLMVLPYVRRKLLR